MAIVLLAVLAFFYGAQNDDGAWQVSRTSQASAAAELGIEPGDVMLSVGGEEVTGFLQFGDLVRARGGELTEVTWERNGEVITDSVVIGSRLTAEGADAFQGLIERDRILAIEGTDVISWDDILASRSKAGRASSSTSLSTRSVSSSRVMIDVEILDITSVENPTVGFFGVGDEPLLDNLGLLGSAWHGVTTFGEWIVVSGEALVQFFTPSTLGNFWTDTLGGGADLSTATDVAEQREINSRALDIRNPDEERILSIYGAARLGANASFEGQLQLLAILNIFIGVFNLLPLPRSTADTWPSAPTSASARWAAASTRSTTPGCFP